MKQQWLVGTALAVSMLFGASVSAEALISESEMNKVLEAPAGHYVYASDDVVRILGHALKRDFAGAHIALATDMPILVEAAIKALKKDHKQYDAAECLAALDILAGYQAELASGNAVITFDNGDVNRKSCCKCKTFGALRVCGNITAGSITVGTLTVTGSEILTGNLTVGGNLTVDGSFFANGDVSMVDGLSSFGSGSFTDDLFVNGDISATAFILGGPSFAYMWNNAAGTIIDDAFVLFGNTTPVSSDITIATDAGTTLITINTTGRYLFEYQVLGLVATGTGPGMPLVFALYDETGAANVSRSVYASETQVSVLSASVIPPTATNGISSVYPLTSLSVHGQIILTVTAGNQFRLRNITGGTVTYNTTGDAPVNAALLITRLN